MQNASKYQKNKPNIQTNELTDINVRGASIAQRSIYAVTGYARAVTSDAVDVPSDVVNIIILLYAKPIKMNIKYNSNIQHIFYCPIRDNWDIVCRKIRAKFDLHKDIIIKYLNYKYGSINSSEWLLCRWNETDIFEPTLDTNIKIRQTCQNLQKYYKRLNVPYTDLFTEYCDTNGLDDECIEEEMNADIEDCLLIEFDDAFPFPTPPNFSKRNQMVFDLIKKCYRNENYKPAIAKLPKFTEKFFEVNDEEIETVKELYEKQCVLTDKIVYFPILWMFTLQWKHKFDYFQYLMQIYGRDRIKKESLAIDFKPWASNHPHFKKIKRFHKQISGGLTYYGGITESISSFQTKICPKLLLCPIVQINDSLKIVIQYIATAIEWIGEMIENAKTNGREIFPFQMDLCLASGEPSPVAYHLQEEYDSDADSHDEIKDYYENSYIDYIGDIENKLLGNKLKYEFSRNNLPDEYPFQRKIKLFDHLLNKFVLKKTNNNYPFGGSRFIVFIDRRKSNKESSEGDEIWMYEPPSNCRDIPKDAVAEWYFNSSMTCLLPNMTYGDGSYSIVQTPNDINIGAQFHCKGSLLTLSFIVKEKDEVRCNLYWNGQMMHFMPEDIKTVFPKLFDMKWNGGEFVHKSEKSLNERFMSKTEEIDELIAKMNKILYDTYYHEFVQSFS